MRRASARASAAEAEVGARAEGKVWIRFAPKHEGARAFQYGGVVVGGTDDADDDASSRDFVPAQLHRFEGRPLCDLDRAVEAQQCVVQPAPRAATASREVWVPACQPRSPPPFLRRPEGVSCFGR
jgi:hypothetical protein